MRKSSSQISMFDTYDAVLTSMEESKPELIKLLEAHIDLESLIPEGFYRAFYKSTGREHSYKKRMEADEALPIYNKYYKRYSARVKVRQIKEADFKRWRYEALQKRDACSRGEITPQELVDWMEAAFPNRKKREG